MELSSKTSWYRRIKGSHKYEVTEEQFYAGMLMPVGHVFDLSVPSWLTWLQSRHDPKLLRMAAWHDLWLKQGMDRGVAAAEARLIARADGIEAWYSHVLHWAMLIWTAYD